MSTPPKELVAETNSMLRIMLTETMLRKLETLRHFRRPLLGPTITSRNEVVTWHKNAVLNPYTMVASGSDTPLAMGSFSYSLSPLGRLRIGRYCSIAKGLSVFLPDHPTSFVTTSSAVYAPTEVNTAAALRDAGIEDFSFFAPAPERKPAPVFENDVWIGANVTMKNGITIGTGAVVAAQSIVTKSVEPYMIVGGNPARPIRRRFNDALCEGLLASEWWRYKWTEFRTLGMDQPEAFLDRLGEAVAQGSIRPYEPEPITWQTVKALALE